MIETAKQQAIMRNMEVRQTASLSALTSKLLLGFRDPAIVSMLMFQTTNCVLRDERVVLKFDSNG